MIPLARRSTPRWLRLLGWIGVVVWAVTITVLSSLTPGQLHELSSFELWDKAAHFLAFALGAANLALALRWSMAWPPARIALAAIGAISAFGALDEFHQLFTPGRSGGDFLDWSADTLGAAAGAGAVLVAYARPARSRLPAPAGD